MLPFRYLIQHILGGEVDWEESTRTVSAKVNGHTFKMVVDYPDIIINGVSHNFGQSPVIISGSTLVPLRAFEVAVSELIWDDATRTVVVVP